MPTWPRNWRAARGVELPLLAEHVDDPAGRLVHVEAAPRRSFWQSPQAGHRRRRRVEGRRPSRVPLALNRSDCSVTF
jgi:hypothetical protein